MGKILDLFFKLDVAVSGGGFKDLQNLGSQFQKVKSAGEKLRGSIGKIDAFQAQQRTVAAEAEKLETLRQNLMRTRQASQASQLGTQTLNIQYTQAQARLASLTGQYPKNSAAVKQARAEVQRLREEYQKSEAASRKFASEEARLDAQVKKTEASLSTERDKLRGIQDALREAGVNTRNLTGEQRKLTEQLRRAENAQARWAQVRSQLNWNNIKTDIIKSAAVITAFRQPIKVDMDFEQAMAQVNAVSSPTAEQFKALRTQALELGSSTQFTATQSANAQEVLARAGLSSSEILTALPHILQTAGAEGMDISQAADILINVTKNMNMPIAELGRVADVMAYTSAHSNTNIAQLGEAALKAAGPFAGMGGTVEELMSTLGSMSNTVRGAEAGTALNGVVRRLGKDPKQVSQALSKYGIKTMTRSGDFAPFAEIIAQVEQQASKMGSKQAAGLRANVYGMFGSQMQGFGRTLFNGEYSTLLKGNNENSGGSSSAMNRTRNDTLKGDITSLGSAWEGLMIRIGKALDPINRFVAETLTTGLQELNKWIDRLGPFADWIARAAYAVGGFLVLKTVWKYVSLTGQAFKAFLELKGAISAIEGTTSAFGSLGSILTSLKAVIMGHPVIAIGTLAAAGAALAIANWDKIKAWFNSWLPPNVWENLAAWCEETIARIKGLWENFKTWMKGLFADLNPFNWEVPSWLGGGKGGENHVKNAQAALGGWQPPEIKAHAAGGILTAPHIGLVAEAGPEAVIPLSDKQRGVPLLMKAAEMLGINTGGTENYSVRNIALPPNPYSPIPTPYSLTPNPSSLTPNPSSPTPINITVNVQGGSEQQDLAGRIAEAVRDALSDIMSLEERVSYA